MGSIIALLVIVAVSLWIVQAGTVALRMTGLDEGTAKFQAMSAFFGVGYTTSEAEMIVNHPVRRRIISHLIIAGNIGLTSALGTVVLTFVREGEGSSEHPIIKALMVGGVVVGVILVARFGPRLRAVEGLVRLTLRRSGYVRPTDYEVMLRINKGFGVGEVRVPPGHWLIGQSLAEARPGRWGALVVGITRQSGEYIAAPTGSTRIEQGDAVAIYGPNDFIQHLADNPLPAEPPGSDQPPAPATEGGRPGTSEP